MGKITKLAVTIILSLILFKYSTDLYDKSSTGKIYNTTTYFLTFQSLNKDFDKETFLFPYHFKFLNIGLSSTDFISYCKYLLVIFTVIILWISFKKLQFTGCLIIATAILLSPVFLIQFNWIGFPEHMMFMTLGLLILLIDYQKNIPDIIFNLLMFTICIIGFWTHFYQFLISAFFILIIDFRYKRHIPLSILINFIIALVVSLILVNLIFHAHGVKQEFDRIEFAFSKNISFWFETHKQQFPISIISLFNGLIFLIIYLIFFQRDWILLSILIASLGITFFTYDTTRVFSNLFYPAFLYYYILHIEEKGYKNFNVHFILLLLGLIFVVLSDPFYIWGSRIIYLK